VLVARLAEPRLEFPFLVCLVSGGHTQLLYAHDVDSYLLLGVRYPEHRRPPPPPPPSSCWALLNAHILRKPLAILLLNTRFSPLCVCGSKQGTLDDSLGEPFAILSRCVRALPLLRSHEYIRALLGHTHILHGCRGGKRPSNRNINYRGAYRSHVLQLTRTRT
jgi:hypothetical protein